MIYRLLRVFYTIQQVSVEPRTSAHNMTLPAAAARAPADIDRHLAPALLPAPRLLLRSLLQRLLWIERRATGQTGGRSTDDRYIDTVSHTMQPASYGQNRPIANSRTPTPTTTTTTTTAAASSSSSRSSSSSSISSNFL